MINIVAITGAGLSVDSGIRPYRGKTGIYTSFEQEHGVPVEELLTKDFLIRHPALFWAYWRTMALNVANVKPNVGHEALVELSSLSNFLEVTQNVDGLSLMAGMAPEKIIELHGEGRTYRCVECGKAHHVVITADIEVPRCDCTEAGPVIRPNVVLFNEQIDEIAYSRLIGSASKADVMLIVGTSSMFPYINYAKHLAERADAVIIDINLDELLSWPKAIHPWRTTASDALPRIAACLKEVVNDSGIEDHLKASVFKQRLISLG